MEVLLHIFFYLNFELSSIVWRQCGYLFCSFLLSFWLPVMPAHLCYTSGIKLMEDKLRDLSWRNTLTMMIATATLSHGTRLQKMVKLDSCGAHDLLWVTATLKVPITPPINIPIAGPLPSLTVPGNEEQCRTYVETNFNPNSNRFLYVKRDNATNKCFITTDP